jgi:hypothetical protein
MLWALLAAALPWGEAPVNSAHGADVMAGAIISMKPMSVEDGSKLRAALEVNLEGKWNWTACLYYYSERYGSLSEPIGDLADSVVGMCQVYAVSISTSSKDVLFYFPEMENDSWRKPLSEIIAEGRRLALAEISEFKLTGK